MVDSLEQPPTPRIVKKGSRSVEVTTVCIG